MIQLQIISKMLNEGETSIVDDFMLTREYFIGYETEYDFIIDHKQQYGVVPDKATFLAQFPTFEIVNVQEPNDYLVDKIREEYTYYRTVPILKQAAKLLGKDSNAAAEYLTNALKDIQPSYRLGGVNIIADADLRYEQFVERKAHPEKYFFTTGFPELDDMIHGINRLGELLVIIARINQGKSWILEKICTHIWQIGYNVGYVSPEMVVQSIGYRFDTLYANYSNNGLAWGKEEIDQDAYKQYIDELKQRDNKFIVAEPKDFNRSITVTKLRNWIKQNKLDFVAIDGIKYLADERGKKTDKVTDNRAHISEDLLALSNELQVPICVVSQVNRSGVVEKGSDDTPKLENISESDSIGQVATKVLAIHQKEYGVLVISSEKDRDGVVGGKLMYDWNINTGEFTFIPTYDDAQPKNKTEEQITKVKKSYKDAKDVF